MNTNSVFIYTVGKIIENREQRTDRQTEKPITEATPIVDRSSGRAGQYSNVNISTVIYNTLDTEIYSTVWACG